MQRGTPLSFFLHWPSTPMPWPFCGRVVVAITLWCAVSFSLVESTFADRAGDEYERCRKSCNVFNLASCLKSCMARADDIRAEERRVEREQREAKEAQRREEEKRRASAARAKAAEKERKRVAVPSAARLVQVSDGEHLARFKSMIMSSRIAEGRKMGKEWTSRLQYRPEDGWANAILSEWLQTLACVEMSAGNYPEAEKHLVRAGQDLKKQKDTRARLLSDLAYVSLRLGQFDQAEQSYRKALNLSAALSSDSMDVMQIPSDGRSVAARLTEALVLQNKCSEAKILAHQVLDSAGSAGRGDNHTLASLSLSIAECMLIEGREPEATKRIAEALTRINEARTQEQCSVCADPDLGRVFVRLAERFALLGENARASSLKKFGEGMLEQHEAHGGFCVE